MKKVTLTFEFDDTYDHGEMNTIVNARRYKGTLFEFSEWLRTRYKHIQPETKGHREEYEQIREEFFAMVRDLDLD